MNLFIIRGKGH